jgi:hypothetical protein
MSRSGRSNPVIGIHSWRFAVRITRRFHRSLSVQCRKRTSRREVSLNCGGPEPKVDDLKYACSTVSFVTVPEVPWTVNGPSERPETSQIPGHSLGTLISQSSAPSVRDQLSTPAAVVFSRPAIQKVPQICSPCSRRTCSFGRNASWSPSPTWRSVTTSSEPRTADAKKRGECRQQEASMPARPLFVRRYARHTDWEVRRGNLAEA